MGQLDTKSQFKARLLRPQTRGGGSKWAFAVLPIEASAKLSRRGRITIDGSINGKRFSVLLEPDGKKSHWLKVDSRLLKAAGATFGDEVQFEIWAVEQEPEPELPKDLLDALHAAPESLTTWDATTTIARLDWIHWIESARQAKTRSKRINDALEMLASGKRRVCCFDPSGFYSKAISAPKAVE